MRRGEVVSGSTGSWAVEIEVTKDMLHLTFWQGRENSRMEFEVQPSLFLPFVDALEVLMDCPVPSLLHTTDAEVEKLHDNGKCYVNLSIRSGERGIRVGPALIYFREANRVREYYLKTFGTPPKFIPRG